MATVPLFILESTPRPLVSPMRYRLRTLLLAVAIVPPLLGAIVWFFTPSDPNVPRDPASRKATADLRQLLLSATSLEVIEAGDATPPRAKSFDRATLKRLADAEAIIEVISTKDIAFSVVENAYLHFRLLDGDKVLEEYWFWYPNALHKTSDDDSDDPHRYYMSPNFSRVLLTELTGRSD